MVKVAALLAGAFIAQGPAATISTSLTVRRARRTTARLAAGRSQVQGFVAIPFAWEPQLFEADQAVSSVMFLL